MCESSTKSTQIVLPNAMDLVCLCAERENSEQEREYLRMCASIAGLNGRARDGICVNCRCVVDGDLFHWCACVRPVIASLFSSRAHSPVSYGLYILYARTQSVCIVSKVYTCTLAKKRSQNKYQIQEIMSSCERYVPMHSLFAWSFLHSYTCNQS